MRDQRSGSIVNIASVVAVAGQHGYLHYVASKGAVLSMTKGLAKELGGDGIRVNVIAPGLRDHRRDPGPARRMAAVIPARPRARG